MKSKKTVVMIVAVLLASVFLLAPVKASTFPSLPATPVTLEINPGPTQWSAFITLSDVPGGYDVTNSPPTYTGWCAHLINFISYGQPYSTTLISSLGLPTPWDKVNYILNNKAGSGLEIQVAIWLLLGFTPIEITSRGYTITANAQNMYDDANNNGGGFIPTAGQLVAVKCENEGDVQDLFIELEIPGEYEGLTPGFWKTHPELWTGYSTDQTFYDVFEVYITINAKGKDPGIYNPTLIQAIGAQGGVNENKGVYDALARHAVAALLNAAHPDVTYPMTAQEIINAVKEAIDNTDMTDAEPLKNMLDIYNNAGGGIDAHGNPIP